MMLQYDGRRDLSRVEFVGERHYCIRHVMAYLKMETDYNIFRDEC
jgi:hypothetical protein